MGQKTLFVIAPSKDSTATKPRADKANDGGGEIGREGIVVTDTTILVVGRDGEGDASAVDRILSEADLVASSLTKLLARFIQFSSVRPSLTHPYQQTLYWAELKRPKLKVPPNNY